MSKGAAGLLGASLLANLFLAGVVLAPLCCGHMGFGRPGLQPPLEVPPPNPLVGITHMMEHMQRDLSPADIATANEIIKTITPVLGATHDERDAAFVHLADVLKTEPLDEAELQKALDAVTAAHTKIDATMGGFIKEIATKLSPQGRHVLADKGLLPHGKDKEGAPARGMMPPHDMPSLPADASTYARPALDTPSPQQPNTDAPVTPPSSMPDGVPLTAPVPEDEKQPDLAK